MTLKAPRPQNAGRAVLLAIAAGTMAISGCTLIEGDGIYGQRELDPQQQKDFNDAINSGDPVLVSRFLRRYPNGPIAEMLSAQSPNVLSRLAPDAFSEISNSTLQLLPPRVIRSLPASVRTRVATTRISSDDSEDPYAG